MDWIHLAKDRDQWRVLLNTVMSLHIPKKFGNSWVTERLVASQGGPSSMKLVNEAVLQVYNRSLWTSAGCLMARKSMKLAAGGATHQETPPFPVMYLRTLFFYFLLHESFSRRHLPYVRIGVFIVPCRQICWSDCVSFSKITKRF
jgi:hypothetical protein